MCKDLWYTIGGVILGSLIEEGLEEIIPGVGEMEWTGEIGGFIAGLLGAKINSNEFKIALEAFIRYAYKQLNNISSFDHVTESELEVFTSSFQDLPVATKKEILNNFKTLAPYEYQFIVDFYQGG